LPATRLEAPNHDRLSSQGGMLFEIGKSGWRKGQKQDRTATIMNVASSFAFGYIVYKNGSLLNQNAANLFAYDWALVFLAWCWFLGIYATLLFWTNLFKFKAVIQATIIFLLNYAYMFFLINTAFSKDYGTFFVFCGLVCLTLAIALWGCDFELLGTIRSKQSFAEATIKEFKKTNIGLFLSSTAYFAGCAFVGYRYSEEVFLLLVLSFLAYFPALFFFARLMLFQKKLRKKLYG
jgi:hypothetical protein